MGFPSVALVAAFGALSLLQAASALPFRVQFAAPAP